MPNSEILRVIAIATEAGREAELGSRNIAESILVSLDAAGFAVRKKPAQRKATAPAEAFSPATGDAQLDDFMRRSHEKNKKRRKLALPRMAGLPALRPMKVSEQEAAERDWNRAVEVAAKHVQSGKPSEAETALRKLIEHHRPTFSRAGGGARSIGPLVYTSPLHPGVEIRETRKNASLSTFEVFSDGERVVTARDIYVWRDAVNIAIAAA